MKVYKLKDFKKFDNDAMNEIIFAARKRKSEEILEYLLLLGIKLEES